MREIASHPARLPLVTFCRERNRLFPFDAATAGGPYLARLGIGDASTPSQLLPARVAPFSSLDRLFDEKDACSSSHKSAFEFPELIVQALPDESEAVQHRRRGIAGKLLDQVLPIFLELPVGGREVLLDRLKVGIGIGQRFPGRQERGHFRSPSRDIRDRDRANGLRSRDGSSTPQAPDEEEDEPEELKRSRGPVVPSRMRLTLRPWPLRRGVAHLARRAVSGRPHASPCPSLHCACSNRLSTPGEMASVVICSMPLTAHVAARMVP